MDYYNYKLIWLFFIILISARDSSCQIPAFENPNNSHSYSKQVSNVTIYKSSNLLLDSVEINKQIKLAGLPTKILTYKDGKLIQKFQAKDALNIKYKYNSLGALTLKTKIFQDSIENVMIEYDSTGCVQTYLKNDSIFLIRYLNENKRIDQIEYKSNSSINHHSKRIKYFYQDDRIIKEEIFENEMLVEKALFSYDSILKKQTKKTYNSNDRLIQTVIREFHKPNQMRLIITQENPSRQRSFLHIWYLDKNDQLIKKYVINNDSKSVETIEYKVDYHNFEKNILDHK